MASATGKTGAFVGIWIFPPIVEVFGGSETLRGNTGPFWIASGLAMFGALIAFLFIHPLTEEGIVKEDRDFREYLEAHGYDTSLMGLGGVDDVATSGTDDPYLSDEKRRGSKDIDKAGI